LESVCLVEKDANADVMVAWTYPSIDQEVQQVILDRVNLTSETIPLQFIWSKYKNQWIYIYTHVNETKQTLPHLAAFSVAVLAGPTGFNPEKFQALCSLMANLYLTNGSPVKLLECYLSVFIRGKYESFNTADYDARRALLVTSIKDVIKMFGLEIILVWSAMLMKKRIVVYSSSLAVLLQIIRAFPLFVWHRQDWNCLRPYVTMTEEQLAELRNAGVYVAGVTDAGMKLKQEYYDLLVDVDSRSISYAEHAAGDFKMGTFHRDVATFLVQAGEAAETTSQSVIKDLAVKTKDLLNKLAQLRTEEGHITLASLQAQKLSPALAHFLYAVAIAENMTKETSK